MRIAHISPFLEQVSAESQDPQGRMIFHLTNQLTRLGHDVSVFASGDSRTACEVVPVAPLPMRAYPAPKRHLAEALAMLALEKAFATLPSFDIIHLHSVAPLFHVTSPFVGRRLLELPPRRRLRRPNPANLDVRPEVVLSSHRGPTHPAQHAELSDVRQGVCDWALEQPFNRTEQSCVRCQILIQTPDGAK